MEAIKDCFKWVKIVDKNSMKSQEDDFEGDQIDILPCMAD